MGWGTVKRPGLQVCFLQIHASLFLHLLPKLQTRCPNTCASFIAQPTQAVLGAGRGGRSPGEELRGVVAQVGLLARARCRRARAGRLELAGGVQGRQAGVRQDPYWPGGAFPCAHRRPEAGSRSGIMGFLGSQALGTESRSSHHQRSGSAALAMLSCRRPFPTFTFLPAAWEPPPRPSG